MAGLIDVFKLKSSGSIFTSSFVHLLHLVVHPWFFIATLSSSQDRRGSHAKGALPAELLSLQAPPRALPRRHQV